MDSKGKKAGRPKGSPNYRTAELKLNLLNTLKARKFDPVAALVEVHMDAKAEYKRRLASGDVKVARGAVGYMKIAEESARDIMPYVYNQLKSVELTGANGQDLFQSFTDTMLGIVEEAKNARLAHNEPISVPSAVGVESVGAALHEPGDGEPIP